MGLDMYLEGRTFNWNDDEHRDGYRVRGVILDLGYWRKHPNLHGYIVREFAGGKDECQDIELSADNIRKIISAIKHKQLPQTEGFFFGKSDGSEDEESIKIFERAWEWLENETAPAPREPEELGHGMAVLMVKPEDFKHAKESRTVIYRASW